MACMCNLLVKLKTTLWLAILLAVGNLRDYIIKHYRNPPPPSLIPIRVRRPPIINLSAPFPMNLVNPIPMAGSGLSIRTGQQQSAQKKKYVTRYKPKPSNQVVVHSTRPRWSTAGPSSSMNSLSLSRSRTTLSSNKQLAELKEVVKKQATQLETQIALLKIQGETMKTQSEALKLQSETLKTQSEMLESLLDERPG
ncbi:hypothetical protein BDN72DRAFT_903492 [Pluteus cervinus]|uniref:Uncharacterized protein n=1 Tax=Pluteus cervinus TaxID=181527 RepID=A0ACD3A9P0_9AGAR|nr:hypothetical protein BDN72DRAFT_903492 [Pluteus cervinus]